MILWQFHNQATREAPERPRSDTRLKHLSQRLPGLPGPPRRPTPYIINPRPISLHQNHLRNAHEIHSHMLPARRLPKTKNYLNHADPRQTIPHPFQHINSDTEVIFSRLHNIDSVKRQTTSSQIDSSMHGSCFSLSRICRFVRHTRIQISLGRVGASAKSAQAEPGS
jgi:hypothetical protein